jgi:hypothetical protein
VERAELEREGVARDVEAIGALGQDFGVDDVEQSLAPPLRQYRDVHNIQMNLFRRINMKF